MFSWGRKPTGVLSPLAEFGIDDEHIEEFRDAVSQHPEWPDLDAAPTVTIEVWTAARNAVDGIRIRKRDLKAATSRLEPITGAIQQLGINFDIIETARLVQYGFSSNANYFVFARRGADKVCFTTRWSPSLMSPTN